MCDELRLCLARLILVNSPQLTTPCLCKLGRSRRQCRDVTMCLLSCGTRCPQSTTRLPKPSEASCQFIIWASGEQSHTHRKGAEPKGNLGVKESHHEGSGFSALLSSFLERRFQRVRNANPRKWMGRGSSWLGTGQLRWKVPMSRWLPPLRGVEGEVQVWGVEPGDPAGVHRPDGLS